MPQHALLPELQQAVSMVSCPYYRGTGICDSGCRSEPQCQTCEPEGGWMAEIAGLAADMAGSERTRGDAA